MAGCWLLSIALLSLCGCQTHSAAQLFSKGGTRSQHVADDPMALVLAAQDRTRQLDTYAVEFVRQERRGLLIPDLRPEERMYVQFRKQPFSVKMTMLDEQHDFLEILFVEGLNDNKMRCRWRRALLPGQKPPTDNYDPTYAVKFGRSLNPITDFGLEKLMSKIVSAISAATKRDLAPAISYHGQTTWHDVNVEHIRIHYSPETKYRFLIVDLYIGSDSTLPVCVFLRSNEDILEARYEYVELVENSTFETDTFQFTN